MDDVRRTAEKRAKRPKTAPVGASFESERQRSKNALVKQLDSMDGRNVRKIAAVADAPQEEKILRVAAYCRVSTDDIDQAISIHLQIQEYKKKILANPNWKYVGTYVDDGFSGTNTEHRQGFQKLNPVERMIVVRPCREDHPNAIAWDAKYKSAAPLTKVIYDSMGWETDYSFRVPCQSVSHDKSSLYSDAVLVFDLDNFIGRATAKSDEVIMAKKEDELETEQREDAKSFYYPPDEDVPQEIQDMEEKFQQAVEANKKIFGTPVFEHDSSIRGFGSESSEDGWDMMMEARPLDITHKVDAEAVDDLLLEIMEDPPAMPEAKPIYPQPTIVVDPPRQGV